MVNNPLNIIDKQILPIIVNRTRYFVTLYPWELNLIFFRYVNSI